MAILKASDFTAATAKTADDETPVQAADYTRVRLEGGEDVYVTADEILHREPFSANIAIVALSDWRKGKVSK